MVMTIIESTFMVIVLGLILAHSSAFSSAVGAVGSLYTGSIRALSSVAG